MADASPALEGPIGLPAPHPLAVDRAAGAARPPAVRTRPDVLVVRSCPGKRVLDVTLGALLFVLTLPVLIAAMAAIKVAHGGPVLFRQQRVGYLGDTFPILKLRTMVIDAERRRPGLEARNAATGLLFKLRDDPRITPLGRIIRRLAIDELPQLLNVLRGEMSLVGPRPLPVQPSAFGLVDFQRHGVRPGITGPWQVLNGDRLGYEQMIELDLGYITRWSLWGDVRLLVRTLPAILRRKGPA